ncbi:hypothetical protein [Pedobacter jamesrossensis]|uniref:N-terminal double-transmembrane domain-containing protein n=1 Tax=Pedobacter jamesrossensis TaxID=1908238 RepID=A0ABV8NLU2_9SPHI
MEFKYIAILVCLILLAFSLFKEFKRTDKSRLIWRILASVLAIGCFALLIIPIKYETHLQQRANEIFLLTDGTNPDSVSKIKGKKYILSSANATELKSSKAKSIENLSYFLKANTTIKKLNIYGYGLTDSELKSSKGYEISFHPSANPTGIISANWQPKIKATKSFLVQGIFQNAGKKPVKLILKGLGSTIDSVNINAQSTSPFSFKNKPKQTGKAIYQLIALQEGDTIAKEPVPFIVEEQPPMKVLILASFPDFEYKFLKKWLYDNQYPLAFRSQISKNKYSTDFLNMDSLNLNRINSTTLKRFDVLIIDEEELAAINTEERSSIDNAASNGMGLFIRISTVKPTTTLSAKFSRYETPALKEKTLSLNIKDENSKLTKLPIEQNLFLKAGTNDQPLITDNTNKILVNSRISGAGKIIISSLSATYNWLLSGKKADYTDYWSTLLSKIARKKLELQSLRIIPQFPVVNQKIRFIADLSEENKIPSIKIDDVKLSPRQNMELPFQWDAISWPQKEGWNNLSVNQLNQSFYVYQRNDWQSLKNQAKIESREQFLKNSVDVSDKNAKTNQIIYNEVSKWYFFAGFLLSAAFLWYESRIIKDK